MLAFTEAFKVPRGVRLAVLTMGLGGRRRLLPRLEASARRLWSVTLTAARQVMEGFSQRMVIPRDSFEDRESLLRNSKVDRKGNIIGLILASFCLLDVLFQDPDVELLTAQFSQLSLSSA